MKLSNGSDSNDGESLPTYKATAKDASSPTQDQQSTEKGRDIKMTISRTTTWHGYALRKRKMRLKTFAKYCPLVSAIFAPLSTLLDIPALTQHWYAQFGTPQSDPTACLILSAIGLALNIIANILLVMRFSAKSMWWWRHATRWSLICWVGKTIVAAINLIIFGILSRNSEGYTYLEGFWCAVISIIDAGIISVTLLFHYYFAFGAEQREKQRATQGDNGEVDVQSEGRRFMLSVTAFISILAVQSLVFSRVEHWSYSDGIYFSTQVALTIGYGDFAPTTSAGKVLIFPFSVLTISQLGNEIALIIGFISDRAEARREKWRKKYEGAMHREANKLRPRANLTEEMALIHQINQREELMSQMYDLFWSALSLVVFWLVGATIFAAIEGWPYGDAIYTVMILSLTIGFGDYTPVQPAGKVVFIVYALMAVPIVTSFAVQTITGLLSTYSERGAIKEAFLTEQRKSPEAFAPHADFVLRYHESYDEMRKRLLKEEEEDEEEDEDEASRQVGRNGNNLEEDAEPKDDEGIAKELTSQEDSNAMYDKGEAAPEQEDDPSNFTYTGRKKSSRAHLDTAEKQLKNDYTRAKSIIEEREEEGKSWERAEIEHQKAAEEDEEAADRSTSPTAKSSGRRRKRQDTERTYVAESEAGQSDTAKAHLQDRQDPNCQSDELEDEQRKLEIDLLKQLMRKTIQLEAEARQMLLDSMDKSVARTLLLADRNVQARDVRALKGDDTEILGIWEQESDKLKQSKVQANRDVQTNNSSSTTAGTSLQDSTGQLDMLSRVRRYRNTFAEILVVGSILQKLEGEEKERFERFRGDHNERIDFGDGAQDTADEQENESSDNGAKGLRKYKTKTEPTKRKSNEVQDIDQVAENKWDGLTSRIYKRWARKVREKDLKKWETV
ncbi:uncharacterized protein I303_103489 [Kwoniella dejecticola CBS 10117]|uniref:Potassium channel domain-containing protein n=1 Tax=Kwoniella dejecticola CBS 10117 TaxID=1296121 RepID=A0A1A6A6W2_9TREE|nr:uncharacterized protein I303_03512 [Kwoniella dejecticola CBS 10117]OBR85799.1 hypothetical protein I303_03512 [Kwoniella dejecticola CBS 10117]